ncbi:divisome protein SepX/GlpR [Actinocorallia longicatena]|uniref:Uncharacterized protein n=1 Tax=Actinocorallia longicatena TaxID=111803 RepID=A0ABP6Q2L8_9ACTN
MSSTLLYLAIVAVWAIVLVPMWLHRDTETTTGFSRLLHRRGDQPGTVAADDLTEHPDDELTPVPGPAQRRNRRAAVIARRRRRTTGLTILTATVPLLPIFDLAPWYVTAPPALLLTAHLALLRTATKIDAQRAAEARENRRHQIRLEAEARAAEAEAAATLAATPDATLLNFTPRTDLFDQYAEDPQDTPRAVND